MRAIVFSAATRETRSGNWVTANRWRKLLASAGYSVVMVHDIAGVRKQSADLFIGIHARRSALALFAYEKSNPAGSTLIALAGTDLYGDLSPTRKRNSVRAVNALDRCHRVILLQPLMAKRLRPAWRKKSSLVMMDVVPFQQETAKRIAVSPLKVCVVGHLRYEKDPFRSALATRDLGDLVRVTHAGQALDDSFQMRAKREASRNANWNWLGSVTAGRVQRLMSTSDLLVNSSRSEGAPNVLFEALAHRLPVIASQIDGHVGVLGSKYPGYFPIGDTDALRNLLIRCASQPKFYQRLTHACIEVAGRYPPGSEQRQLLAAITQANRSSPEVV